MKNKEYSIHLGSVLIGYAKYIIIYEHDFVSGNSYYYKSDFGSYVYEKCLFNCHINPIDPTDELEISEEMFYYIKPRIYGI